MSQQIKKRQNRKEDANTQKKQIRYKGGGTE